MPSRKPKARLPKPSAPQRKELPVRPRWLAGVANGPPGSRPTWRLSRLDLDHAGSWSWTVTAADLREIVEFLSQMERLTWTEIKSQLTSSRSGSHRKHHPMPVERLCEEAQRRLETLRLDVDELFRFRLSGRRRLWGAIDDGDGSFYAVWWDPDHRVYPVDRD